MTATDAKFTYQGQDPFTGKKLGKPWTLLIPLGDESHVQKHDDDDVPEGTIAEVEAWVDDPSVSAEVRSDRAKAALVAEQSRGQSEQRKTLIASLQGRLTA